MMWWMDGFHWEWMLTGGLMMLLFWGGLIGLAVVIIRAFAGAGRTGTPGRSRALEILEERFARGEIDKNEFEAMRSNLSH